ncbi:hypothetical protein GQR58_004785 [Nymphon striatum]|nr:hypothetical protein GQR58_004785 [Nymphon striatum]
MPRSESPSDDNSCDQVPVSNFTMSSPRSPQIAGFATLLPEYSGASDQGRPFFEAVESVARLANWDDDTTLIVVRSKFVGEAAHFLRESIDLRTGTNLQTFKAAVLARFQPSFPLTLRLQKFMSCKQKIDEGVLPYAARFKNLAYDTIEPDASEAVRQAHEKQMVAQFLSGLTFSGKRFVMSKNPTKLEETIKIAVDEECNSQLMGQDKGKNVCSAVTADETNDLAELKALFVQVLTKLDRNAPQPLGSSQFERPPPRNLPTSPASSRPVSPAPMRRRCFQCGNDRHLIANCPDLRRSEPSSSSPGCNVTLMGVTGKVLDTVGCFKLPIQINDQCFTFPMYVTNESFTSRYDGIIGIDFCKRFGVTYDAQNRRVIIKDRGIEVEESINNISAIDHNKKFLTTPVLNNARINQPNKISLASPANSRNFVSTPQRKMPEQRYALRSTGTVPKLPWIFESTSTKEVTGTTENPASAVVTAPEPHVDVSAGNASVDVPMSEVDTCSKEETELRENDTEMDLASSILAKMDYWLS